MKNRIKHGLIRVFQNLLLVLLAAVLLFFIFRSWKNSRVSAENEESGVAVTEDLSAVTSVSCNNGTETLTFSLGEDGQWHWIDDTFPLNSEAVADLVYTLSSFVPTVTVASGETVDLGSYELDSPAYEVSYTTAGGETTALQFGKAADNGGSYVKYADDATTVYLAGATLTKTVTQGLYDYCTLPSFPVLTSETLQFVTFSSAKNSTTYAAKEQKGETRWFLGGRDVTQDAAFTAALDEIRSLSFASCLVWNPVQDSLAICGLEEPHAQITLEYKDDNGRDCALILYVGNERDENHWFASWSASSAIFTLHKGAVDSILALIDNI